jgi:hypothetical protein
MILLFPFVFYNTGARDYVVVCDMRIRFADGVGRHPAELGAACVAVSTQRQPGHGAPSRLRRAGTFRCTAVRRVRAPTQPSR